MNEFEQVENELHKLRMSDPTFNTDLIQSACKKLEKASKLLNLNEMAVEWVIGEYKGDPLVIQKIDMRWTGQKKESEFRYFLKKSHNLIGNYMDGYATFEEAYEDGKKFING